ncbi:hypothetical protein BMS3Abin11_00589 [bacterium BMS3Abin11]|nr:hypothetical protein BMS3Abin11_00589 [bacterium BMS3Abin11]
MRNIKTTLGMEVLSCKTPDMVRKEIWVYLLAYNLIRLLMVRAALLGDLLPRQLSFKYTLQLYIAWRKPNHENDDERLGKLLILIAHKQVGNRQGRIEPRAVKRRPKPYPLLTKTRKMAQEEIRKNGHAKKLK